MTAEPNQTAGPTGKSHSHHLSSDGKWRSFPKIPHLLQYVSMETFYGRTKVNGKIIRQIARSFDRALKPLHAYALNRSARGCLDTPVVRA